MKVFQILVYWGVSWLHRMKNTVSSRTSPQAGVAIPYGGAEQHIAVNQRIFGRNSSFPPTKAHAIFRGIAAPV